MRSPSTRMSLIREIDHGREQEVPTLTHGGQPDGMNRIRHWLFHQYHDERNPGVSPPHDNALGKSYEEWAAWWQ